MISTSSYCWLNTIHFKVIIITYRVLIELITQRYMVGECVSLVDFKGMNLLKTCTLVYKEYARFGQTHMIITAVLFLTFILSTIWMHQTA